MSINNINKKVLILSVLIIAGLAFAGYTYYQNKNNGEQETVTDDSDYIDYGPATEQDVKDADEHKANLPSADEFEKSNSNSNSSSNKSVTPEITSYGLYNGNVEVASRVPGIFENSGQCTLILKKGSKSISQTKAATPNVSEMSCGLIKIPKSKLSNGTWKATITYSSNKASGTSSAVSVEVK